MKRKRLHLCCSIRDESEARFLDKLWCTRKSRFTNRFRLWNTKRARWSKKQRTSQNMCRLQCLRDNERARTLWTDNAQIAEMLGRLWELRNLRRNTFEVRDFAMEASKRQVARINPKQMRRIKQEWKEAAMRTGRGSG